MAKDPKARARRLSQEEAALWARIADTAEPLRKAPDRPLPAAAETPEPPAPTRRRHAASQAVDRHPRRTVSPDGETPPLAPLARKESRQITSGRAEIGARLDLHGMRQRQAYPALKAFLRNAHASGHRYVLVITGKGAPRPEEPESFFAGGDRGVLRRLVPEWLGKPEFRQWVAGYQSAHRRHGGEGALYIRLRRPDRPKR